MLTMSGEVDLLHLPLSPSVRAHHHNESSSPASQSRAIANTDSHSSTDNDSHSHSGVDQLDVSPSFDSHALGLFSPGDSHSHRHHAPLTLPPLPHHGRHQSLPFPLPAHLLSLLTALANQLNGGSSAVKKKLNHCVRGPGGITIRLPPNIPPPPVWDSKLGMAPVLLPIIDGHGSPALSLPPLPLPLTQSFTKTHSHPALSLTPLIAFNAPPLSPPLTFGTHYHHHSLSTPLIAASSSLNLSDGHSRVHDTTIKVEPSTSNGSLLDLPPSAYHRHRTKRERIDDNDDRESSSNGHGKDDMTTPNARKKRPYRKHRDKESSHSTAKKQKTHSHSHRHNDSHGHTSSSISTGAPSADYDVTTLTQMTVENVFSALLLTVQCSVDWDGNVQVNMSYNAQNEELFFNNYDSESQTFFTPAKPPPLAHSQTQSHYLTPVPNHNLIDMNDSEDEPDESLLTGSDEEDMSDNDDYGSVTHNDSQSTLSKSRRKRKGLSSRKSRLILCPDCNCEFANEVSMYGHITNAHRRYVCPNCQQSFDEEPLLKAHLVEHSRGRQHICTFCGEGFTQSGHCKEHERIHTGEKPFVCHVIGCERGFSRNSYLKQHARIHTGEKRFICDQCDKGFRQSSTLKSHKRIHTGEKPYSCNECGKTFRHGNTRKAHMISEHGHTANGNSSITIPPSVPMMGSLNQSISIIGEETSSVSDGTPVKRKKDRVKHESNGDNSHSSSSSSSGSYYNGSDYAQFRGLHHSAPSTSPPPLEAFVNHGNEHSTAMEIDSIKQEPNDWTSHT